MLLNTTLVGALAVAGGLLAAAPAGASPAASAAPAATAVHASAAAPAPGPAAAAADPLEQLRTRLAERLAGARTLPAGSAGGPADLHVVARTPGPAVAPSKPAVGAAKAVAHKTAGGSAAAHAAAHAAWGYAGAVGPAAWGALKPEFGACTSGSRQSPIDIRGGLPVDLDPVQFVYQASRFGVVDNGHTVQVNMAAGNAIVVGGKRFELQQFHFHRPSEERIDGRQFEMSVHLVHKDEQGRLAVVTVLLDKGVGTAQPVVQKVWNNLPLERGEEAGARAPLDLNELLPADRRYYTYMGSLTTPPCSEGVQWIVMRQPVAVSAEQIELFARIYPMNARPLQAASGRRILQSN